MRILLVDDMPAMRMVLRNMLEEMGFNDIQEAEDGDVAWRMIRETGQDQGFDLVIADWNMPTMSGVELVRAIRNSRQIRETPFLLVTAQGSQSNLAEASHAGVTDYVVKPFSAEQLSFKISRAITGNA